MEAAWIFLAAVIPDLQKMRNPEVEQLANCDDEDCLSESTPALAFHPAQLYQQLE